jgi:alpha-L-rhamnosidase
MKRRLYYIILFLCSNFLFTASSASDSIEINGLRCETLSNPDGIDVTVPRFSWQIKSPKRNIKQNAYQVIVASSLEMLIQNKGDIWNSGKVGSDQSVYVTYKGRSLTSGRKYFWKVRVWTNNKEGQWSEPARFSTAFLNPKGWKAKWIGLDRAFSWDSVSMFARLSARYFRKETSVNKKIKNATIYISGLGLYELYINGKKIGDQVLAPGPTDYGKTILYNTFDVTDKLKQGQNALGVILGNGRFFAMRQNYKPHKWHTFGFPKVLLQLEIVFADGTKQTIVSDNSWKVTADGPIRTNNEYDGEEYDATKELGDWNSAGFDDSNWLKAELVQSPGGVLKAQINGNMKVMQTLKPLSLRMQSPGRYILDMGQNMAGWVKIHVRGEFGDSVKLRFAESLQPDGELFVANLRDAKVTDVYVLKGNSDESWSPRFVYHGFRFVEITGYPNVPTIDEFVGEVVYDNMKTIGKIETSNVIINQIHKNAFWGILSNYKGMPVDCPQRNERQPWLGDRTTGAYGESFLFDNQALYSKWLNDIRDAQTPEGSIPDVAPNFWYYYKDNMTWPGAYLTIGDMLFRQYGDQGPIRKHYPSMKKWMAYMKSKYLTKDFIMTKDSYGDWCVPPESPELIHSRDSLRTTNPQLIATAYYYYYLQLMERFALISDQKHDVAQFRWEAMQVKKAFNLKFFNNLRAEYSNNTVTANLLPLVFGMVTSTDTARVFKNICDKILVDNSGHISTGVIGTQWLMRWLTYYGRADIAFRLASNTTYPSWGYMVANGATTIWELWNGNTANPGMNSQNHVMLLGDLLIWVYEHLGGIRSHSSERGFKRIVMKPSFDVDLEFVNAFYQSPYGEIRSDWKKEGKELLWIVEIPANTAAEIYIPANSLENIKESGLDTKKAEGVKFLRIEKNHSVFEIGSGHYSFAINGLLTSGNQKL